MVVPEMLDVSRPNLDTAPAVELVLFKKLRIVQTALADPDKATAIDAMASQPAYYGNAWDLDSSTIFYADAIRAGREASQRYQENSQGWLGVLGELEDLTEEVQQPYQHALPLVPSRERCEEMYRQTRQQVLTDELLEVQPDISAAEYARRVADGSIILHSPLMLVPPKRQLDRSSSPK